MFDIKRLIVEIERRPYLWNIADKSYCNNDLKQKAWIAIAEVIFQEEWNNLTISAQQDKVRLIRMKWRSSRDHYNREKKKDAGSKKRNKTPLLKMMSFLDVLYEPLHRVWTLNNNASRLSQDDISLSENIARWLEDTMSAGGADQNKPKQSKCNLNDNAARPLHDDVTSENVVIKLEEAPSDADATASKSPQSPILSSRRGVNGIARKNAELKIVPNEQTHNDESNRSFLMSFLTEMNNMTERQNFEFKMEMMKALNKVKYRMLV